MAIENVLYINGLGNGRIKTEDNLLLRRLLRKGFDAEHAQVNWESGEPLQTIHGIVGHKARSLLQKGGQLAIVGRSAGGSEALRVFRDLRDEAQDVFMVGICARMAVGEFGPEDPNNLRNRAHLKTKRASHSFYDAVFDCDQVVIPSLSEEDKSRIQLMVPGADETVPLSTMRIEGVQAHRIPMVGHWPSGIIGGYQLPGVLKELADVH